MALSELLAPDINLAWKTFTKTGRVNPGKVRPEIMESWIRCYKAGVDHNDGACSDILDPIEFQDMIERHRDLVEVAKPFLENIYNFVQGSGFIVILTDERGYIMESLGDQHTMLKASKINFIHGANWTEEQVGTNAIGTALVLKRPIQVNATEHFCRKHHTWTCSASPIFDDDGQLIGILDLSGPSQETHVHTLGMVVAAVKAIVDQMSIRRKNRELSLVNNRLSNIIHTMSEGLMIVDQQGTVVQLNPSAERIVGMNNLTALGRSAINLAGSRADDIVKMLEQGRPFNEVEFLIDSGQKRFHFLASGQPIEDNQGTITGGVILLHPIEKTLNLVNRFSGAQATFRFKDIIGCSREMQGVIKVANMAANSMANVLLEGESGTGKDVFAQAIHNMSSRRNGPYTAINCGAIPRELIGSELFGYDEGAFTGAKRGGRPGKFELASGGTIFLDEIGDMPLEHQVALLRVLQEKQVTRIGSSKVVPVDVRVICASNKNLLEEVEKGSFRLDLYYRLNVITISIPALRERRDDIPLLFNYYLSKICRDLKIDVKNVEPEVLEYLVRYDWPGNVRELQNIVERVVNMMDGPTICLEHLPAEVRHPVVAAQFPKPALLSQIVEITNERAKIKKVLAEKEREEILALLFQNGGNVSQTAKEMGISRNTFYRKIRLYKIDI